MVRDVKPTLDGIRRAVEEYGSISHLAVALQVTPQSMLSWYRGEEEMPLDRYEEMLAIVAAWKSRR